MRRKCVITLIEGSTKDRVDLHVQWTPSLDMKDESKNHPALTTAVFRMLEAVSASTKKATVRAKVKK